MVSKYSWIVWFSVVMVNDLHANQSPPAVYPNSRSLPVELAHEDYQLSNLALQGLTGLYINLDDAINSAQPKNIQLPSDLKTQVIRRLEKAGMRLLSKEEMEKTPGQPEMSMFPSYPKHLGPFKPGEPRIEYNAQCCTAGIWTSFTQGASTLRNPLLNHKLATWGEGHNTTDCTDIGKWLGEVVLKTVDNFIIAKQKADQEYKLWLAKQPKQTSVVAASTHPKPAAQLDTKLNTKSEANLANPVVEPQASRPAQQELVTPATDKVVEVHTVQMAETAPALACDTAVLLYAELFPTASATLNRTNIAILAKLADNIKACPQYRYRIETHSDQRADTEYNEILSARRAVAIRNYLVDHGVNEDQFELRFYGERKPVVMGDDEAAWAANRRVVVMPLKTKTSGF